MSLRDQLIEAGARRLHPYAWQTNLHEAQAVLDAILDTLEDNSEKWKEAAFASYPVADPAQFGAAAVAALRDIEAGPQ